MPKTLLWGNELMWWSVNPSEQIWSY